MSKLPNFPYNPDQLPREKARHYIMATETEIQAMLTEVGAKSLDDLFSDLPENIKHKKNLDLPAELPYQDLAQHVFNLSQKNRLGPSFIGDGLPQFKTASIVNDICSIRGLTTAYTPYQPERSQGTLQTLWIYQSLLAEITGFEAINSSLYDRATCLFEAFNCALRLNAVSTKVIVAENLYPNDLEVLKTHAAHTEMQLVFAPVDHTTGTLDRKALEKILESEGAISAFAFPQVNNFGNLEDVDALTDFCTQNKIKSIAIVNPMLLANNALKAPVHFGSQKQGCDIIVGEGQHLALGPNFGGPGLGIFGIRFNQADTKSIRATAGRFVGKAKDLKGRECKAIILSTREQHIRREKATSNICSNQAFVASLAGACLLTKGAAGLEKAATIARENTLKTLQKILTLKGIELKFPKTAFYNEVTLKLDQAVAPLMKKAQKAGLQIGVDVSKRNHFKENLLLISLSDRQTDNDINALYTFLKSEFSAGDASLVIPEIPKNYLRQDKLSFPQLPEAEVVKYYQNLGKQNLSPDDGLYPLGSCTMKYNPYINDFAAGFQGFTDLHPQSPAEDSQGALELMYGLQEMFKEITGLPGLTTQPVAGAQGELVGLKMFQAYHADRKENRDVMIIPRSAHGTNPATATMAGYETIALIDADESGRMNIEQVKKTLNEYRGRIAGMMVTNPNTAGIFESNFKLIADLIHSEGGLVYMDGANMNAIAGWVDLNKLGVDAVHNNLHKTWTIPHGGGGPGDAIVAVSDKLLDYLPGYNVVKNNGQFELKKAAKSVGEFHRHHGNFAHKVRAYTYLRALGPEGVKRMSAVAVLSARYLLKKLANTYPTLPKSADATARMHEFILTLTPETFAKIEKEGGVPKANIIARIGKLFLDFGFHAPTVAFPEQFGLMIEPTESFSKKELDEFVEVVETIHKLIVEKPSILQTVPHFTPIDRVDEVAANRDIVVSEKINKILPEILVDRKETKSLRTLGLHKLTQEILKAHQA
ncbi:MAG: aminomethyl-transferring glycine dehydrogenase subunit GcvPB [Bacteriovoracaceae bacterium]|nr:aminomethyl-transferring glycine dehydrogenase subunit GcvPB [Bacteriovoracaceae bacterium]